MIRKIVTLRMAARLRPPAGVFASITAQLLVTVASIANGVMLARGTDLELRGYVVIFTTGLSIGTVLITVGTADLILHHRPNEISGHLAAAATSVLVVSATASALLVGPPSQSIPPLARLILGILIFASGSNSLLFAWSLLHSGLSAVSKIRVAYAVVLVGSTTTLYVASASSLSWLDVLSAMVAAELATSLCLVVSLIKSKRPDTLNSRQLSLKIVAQRGPSFMLASLGTLMADRGLVLITSAAAGLQTTALLSVAQSASSPVSMPATALGPTVQLEAGKRPERSPYRFTARILSSIVAVVVVPLNYFLMVPLYGSQYESLRSSVLLISAYGLLTAFWRLVHFALRGEGRPFLASITDGVALLCVLALYLIAPAPETARDLLGFMICFAGAGVASGLLIARYWGLPTPPNMAAR